ncbi:MAG: ABC transporter substrate-binding protein [Clostridium sp.]
MLKKHKIIALLTTVFVASTIFIGCKKETEPATLNFFNWAENIPQSVIDDFTKETGIKVTQSTYADMGEMYTKLTSDAVNYDLAVPSDYMVDRLIKEDRLQKLDFNNIPNFNKIDDSFKKTSVDPKNEYSVPYMSGTIGILYNKDLVKGKIDSWNDLWDPKYKGEVFMLDDKRDALGATLKSLGYSLNTTNKKELDEASKKLKNLKTSGNLLAYGSDDLLDKMVAKEASLCVLWSGEGLNLADEYDYLDFVVPKEGADFWVDSLVIPKNAPHKKEAEMFINYLCKKDQALKIANEIGYTTPQKEAKEEQKDSIKNNPNAYMPKEILEKCETYKFLGDKEKLYEEAYMNAKDN